MGSKQFLQPAKSNLTRTSQLEWRPFINALQHKASIFCMNDLTLQRKSWTNINPCDHCSSHHIYNVEEKYFLKTLCVLIANILNNRFIYLSAKLTTNTKEAFKKLHKGPS